MPQDADVVLRDGSTVHVRPVRPDDEPGLAAFLHGLSEEGRVFRFFSGATNVDRWAHQAARAAEGEIGLVALAGPGGRIAAHAQVVPISPTRGEMAFAVADDLQGRGLATVMLAHLAQYARAQGVEVLEAEVMPANHRMSDVFRRSGFPVDVRWADGVMRFESPTALTPETIERFERRAHDATKESVAHVLRPGSVGVVGAPDVLANLRASGAEGIEAAEGVEAELVVVRGEPGDVLATATRAGAAGARALVVLSGGFAEAGAEGLALQAELLATCRSHGMRLLGPNSIGALAPGCGLNATIYPRLPPHGDIGLLTQSGSVGLALLERAARLGLGLSSFAATGNRADLSGNDFLRYWRDDEATRVVLLYLESFGNPRNFARIAREVSRRKPVVAVKSGRTPAGVRAAASHTGALVAASETNVAALFRQAGVIRTDTLPEMIDVARLLATQPLPEGERVGIVTSAGGPGILCADACAAEGLDVAAPPTDVRATATPGDYAAAAAAHDCDAVIAIVAPPAQADPHEVANAITAATPVPLLVVTMGGGEYAFPEEAARALARAAGYARWRRAPQGTLPSFDDVRREDAAALLAQAAAHEPRWLEDDGARGLLEAWGLRLADHAPYASAEPVSVGVTLDPRFGPLVACGAAAAGHGEVDVRLTPLTVEEAQELAGVGREALADILLRVAALADAHPEVLAVDLDPVAARQDDAAILAARVLVATATPEPAWPALGTVPPRAA